MPTLQPFTTRPERSRGQSLVELALIAPLLLLLMAAAIDLGRLFYAYVAVENAAKEGALYGAVNPICATQSSLCPNPMNVTWRVQNETGASALPGGIQVGAIQCLAPSGTSKTLVSCVDGDTYVVNASHQFTLITPIIGSIVGNSLTLSSQSRSIVLNEAFDPTPGAAVQKYVCEGAACTDFEQTPTLDTNNQPVYFETEAGEILRYRLSVTNIGGQALTGTTISDTVSLPLGTTECPNLPNPLARNATWTCLYTRVAPDPPSGDLFELLSNNATFDAIEVNSVPQVATVRVLARPAEFRVTKFVSPYYFGNDGDGNPAFGATPSAELYLPSSGNAAAWFSIVVTNTGGQPATGVVITDTAGIPFGQQTGTANCGAAPATLAPNQSWSCRYRAQFSSPGTTGNTVTATADNVTPDGNDSATASVTVRPNGDCAGSNRVVPLLVTRTYQSGSGTTFSDARTAWTNAGFTGAFSPANGQNNAIVWTQSRQAFSCLDRTVTMSVTNSNTP